MILHTVYSVGTILAQEVNDSVCLTVRTLSGSNLFHDELF